MIQVNRIYLIFNRLVTKKFLVDTSDHFFILYQELQLYKQHYFYRKKGGDNILYLLH